MSDTLEPALNAMHMNGLLRIAVKLIRGTNIKLTETHFEFAVVSVISCFKVGCWCTQVY